MPPQTKCGFTDSVGVLARDLLIRIGPTLPVDIGFDPTYTKASKKDPTPAIRQVNALVDTGAAECCIDSGMAMELNLPIVDRRPVGGISGIKMANMHLAQIHIPSIKITLLGAFAGVDLIAGGQAHHALIGRTVLQHFKMIYDGNTGMVTLSW